MPGTSVEHSSESISFKGRWLLRGQSNIFSLVLDGLRRAGAPATVPSTPDARRSEKIDRLERDDAPSSLLFLEPAADRFVTPFERATLLLRAHLQQPVEFDGAL